MKKPIVVSMLAICLIVACSDDEPEKSDIPGPSNFRGDPYPRSAPAAEEDTSTKIEIVIRPTGEIYENCQYEIDGFPVMDDPEKLRETLAELVKTRGADTPVVIRSMGMVRWKYIVEAFNAAVSCKFEKIGFDDADKPGVESMIIPD